MNAVGSRFVGAINSAVVMTADTSAGSLSVARLVSSPLAERLLVTVCFRHRWYLLTTVFVAPTLSASRLASKVCYTIKYGMKYEHIICAYGSKYEHVICAHFNIFLFILTYFNVSQHILTYFNVF